MQVVERFSLWRLPHLALMLHRLSELQKLRLLHLTAQLLRRLSRLGHPSAPFVGTVVNAKLSVPAVSTVSQQNTAVVESYSVSMPAITGKLDGGPSDSFTGRCTWTLVQTAVASASLHTTGTSLTSRRVVVRV